MGQETDKENKWKKRGWDQIKKMILVIQMLGVRHFYQGEYTMLFSGKSKHMLNDFPSPP